MDEISTPHNAGRKSHKTPATADESSDDDDEIKLGLMQRLRRRLVEQFGSDSEKVRMLMLLFYFSTSTFN